MILNSLLASRDAIGGGVPWRRGQSVEQHLQPNKKNKTKQKKSLAYTAGLRLNTKQIISHEHPPRGASTESSFLFGALPSSSCLLYRSSFSRTVCQCPPLAPPHLLTVYLLTEASFQGRQIGRGAAAPVQTVRPMTGVPQRQKAEQYRRNTQASLLLLLLLSVFFSCWGGRTWFLN